MGNITVTMSDGTTYELKVKPVDIVKFENNQKDVDDDNNSSI